MGSRLRMSVLTCQLVTVEELQEINFDYLFLLKSNCWKKGLLRVEQNRHVYWLQNKACFYQLPLKYPPQRILTCTIVSCRDQWPSYRTSTSSPGQSSCLCWLKKEYYNKRLRLSLAVSWANQQQKEAWGKITAAVRLAANRSDSIIMVFQALSWWCAFGDNWLRVSRGNVRDRSQESGWTKWKGRDWSCE